jgi:hypothetical protein
MGCNTLALTDEGRSEFRVGGCIDTHGIGLLCDRGRSPEETVGHRMSWPQMEHVSSCSDSVTVRRRPRAPRDLARFFVERGAR